MDIRLALPTLRRMANVTNLNRFRKTKARAAAKAQADENAVKFGRPKSDRTRDAAELARRDAALDGHKRDDP